MKSIILILIVIFSIHGLILGQENKIPIYKNAQYLISERVSDLLSRMTAEEKFWQLFMIPGEIKNLSDTSFSHGLFGFQISAGATNQEENQQLLKYDLSGEKIATINKVNKAQQYFIEHTRLGIPIIVFDEALHGLVRKNATIFPQSIALAATWDTSLMHKVASAIAAEAMQLGIRQVLSPVINLATDPRWGRTEETYGEDPFLSAAMGVAYIKAFESKNIITTPKHFIANVGDGGRDSYPIHYNERRLYENDFVPFIQSIRKAGARSIMTAYNSIDGRPASANNWLLNTTLKNKWGFKGFVISDASAVGGANVLHNTSDSYSESGKQAIINGLDVIFQTAHEHSKLFIKPFLDGSIPKEKIDSAVARVLTAKFELGLFEHPYISENLNDSAQLKLNKSIAETAAISSLVLLKNENHILPINPTIKNIAVIGKDANEKRMGGYSGSNTEIISILSGIKKYADQKHISIAYEAGTERTLKNFETIPNQYLFTEINGKNVPGLLGSYYNNIALNGNPDLKRVDNLIDFHWTLFPPDQIILSDFYSVKWQGSIKSTFTGKKSIGLEGTDGFRLYFKDQLIIDKWDEQNAHSNYAEVLFEKGKNYALRIEFKAPNGNAHIRLVWGIENDLDKKEIAAIKIAKKSDLILFTAGIEEGEFRDRSKLSLPGNQEKLLQELLSLNKPVVVLLVGGSVITMQNWNQKAAAILECWYPGERGGNAIASVLFGETNPSGKLPLSFVNTEGQLPWVYNHLPTGRGDDYNDQTGLPLYPFGFGLSYTNFNYQNLKIDKPSMGKNDTANISFDLTNSGLRDGEETVQLYLRKNISTVAQPIISLKGFQKISLKRGETKTVSFKITKEQLATYDLKLDQEVEPGVYRIMIGASSRDMRLKGNLTIQ